jgi:hypothetical protein
MSGSFDGDLIRPLGEVTLNFGYAEAQVNYLLEMLRTNGVTVTVLPTTPLGQRIAEFATIAKRLKCVGAAEVVGILEEAKSLIDQRNDLVHASVLAGGRVRPNDPAKPSFVATPESLTALAQQIFNWKERLNAAVQKRLLPALRERANGT